MDVILKDRGSGLFRPVLLVGVVAATSIALMFSFSGWTTSPPRSNGPSSSIGKSGEMKSPGGQIIAPARKQ